MELRAEIAISAPADAAWAVVGEAFGQIGEWAVPITASGLDGAVAVGATRTCQVARFGPFAPGVIQERLTAFDPIAMSLEYESTAGLRAFVRSAANRWSVHHCQERPASFAPTLRSSCGGQCDCWPCSSFAS